MTVTKPSCFAPRKNKRQIYPAVLARGQIHCLFMTIPLRFYDTMQVPAGRASPGPSPAKAL
jgi:hypothetical protein